MPLRQRNYFNIEPNENIKYPEGTFFVYYSGEYLVRHATESHFKKVIPWETFYVTQPLMTKELIEKYKNGRMWLKSKSGWNLFSEWKPSISEESKLQGIGYWIISEDFVVS